MYPLKKILICLDLSEIDEMLVAYASMMCPIVGAESISFIHVAKSLDIPAEIRERFPGLLPLGDETIKKRIKSSLETSLGKWVKANTRIVLEEGNPTQKIAQYVKENDIDLVIVGRKLELSGTGILPQKLVRFVPCNVLFVPENNPSKISTIMVPVDFSDQSAKALLRAINIAKSNDIEVVFHNVYTVPVGYSRTGKSYEEFAEIMERHAERDFTKFIKKFDLEDIRNRCIYTLDNHSRPADKIYHVALKEEVSMIVVGAKGKTGAATMLLGSVTEQLANYNSQIPLFIVKDKTETLNFFEALLHI